MLLLPSISTLASLKHLRKERFARQIVSWLCWAYHHWKERVVEMKEMVRQQWWCRRLVVRCFDGVIRSIGTEKKVRKRLNLKTYKPALLSIIDILLHSLLVLPFYITSILYISHTNSHIFHSPHSSDPHPILLFFYVYSSSECHRMDAPPQTQHFVGDLTHHLRGLYCDCSASHTDVWKWKWRMYRSNDERKGNPKRWTTKEQATAAE